MESNWRKSSYSGSNGGECVEVASAEAVVVRDTSDRNGPMLAITAAAWAAFTATIKLSRSSSRLAHGVFSHLSAPPLRTRGHVCQAAKPFAPSRQSLPFQRLSAQAASTHEGTKGTHDDGNHRERNHITNGDHAAK